MFRAKVLKIKLIVRINQNVTSKFKIKLMMFVNNQQSKKSEQKVFSLKKIIWFFTRQLRLKSITLHKPMERKRVNPSTKNEILKLCLHRFKYKQILSILKLLIYKTIMHAIGSKNHISLNYVMLIITNFIERILWLVLIVLLIF